MTQLIDTDDLDAAVTRAIERSGALIRAEIEADAQRRSNFGVNLGRSEEPWGREVIAAHVIATALFTASEVTALGVEMLCAEEGALDLIKSYLGSIADAIEKVTAE